MRSDPRTPHSCTSALRAFVVAGVTGGVLAVTVLGTTAAAASDGSVRGTVVSGGDLNLRAQPTTDSRVVGTLAPGSRAVVDCEVRGQKVLGDPHWYWLGDVRGWASAAYVDTHGRSVPNCTDPCPSWKDCDPCQDGHGSGSVSFTWTFTASGTWEWEEE